MNIIDNISADTIEVGDQIIIEEDLVEVKGVGPSNDIDEIVVNGYSHVTGDSEVYSLYADDYYDVWAV
jgi:hypothetical protein